VTLDTSRAVARAGGRSLVASTGGRMEAELTDGGGALVRMPVHARDPLTLALNSRRLLSVIRVEGVSLVHVRSRAPAFSAIWAARAAGVPAVATYHGIYQAHGPLKRWYNGVMTRADLTIANSTFTRDHVIAEHGLGAGRLAVVPEGVDTEVFDPGAVSAERVARVRAAWGLGAADRRPILLLAARLTGWKGQGLMVEALTRLNEPADPWLILAGKAEKPGQAEAIETAARRAGVADRVRIVGPVDDMPAAMAAATLVVAPSTLPESFGRTVAEAGAMARPVLASPLGGPAETVSHGETGWLVPAGDVDAWAAAVDGALGAGADALALLGRRARERVVHHYSLEAMTEQTFGAYHRLLGARP
jgi:glycosyltransferase involved in cell wall biosynthesis